LLSIVIHCYPLLSIVIHCYPLLSIVIHYQQFILLTCFASVFVLPTCCSLRIARPGVHAIDRTRPRNGIMEATNGHCRMGPPRYLSCLISGWILWFMVDITIVNGIYKPTYNYGAPSCGGDPRNPINNITYNTIWLVVDLPLWKIWLRQLGWWNSQYMGKENSCSKPPTSYVLYVYTCITIYICETNSWTPKSRGRQTETQNKNISEKQHRNKIKHPENRYSTEHSENNSYNMYIYIYIVYWTMPKIFKKH